MCAQLRVHTVYSIHTIAKALEPPTSVWAGVLANGTSHNVHTHARAVLSAVYYISAPENAAGLSIVGRSSRVLFFFFGKF